MSNKKVTFSEARVLRTFSEFTGGNELHILPLGTWDHPKYGEIVIDAHAVAEFVRNFNDGVRLKIPITAGHEINEEKPARGWFQEVFAREDGLWAIVSWTKQGLKLLQEEAYRYFSAEYHLDYNDPQSRLDYSHVLVGGALTNKPYFKNLSPVSFSETKDNIIIQFSEKSMNLKDLLQKKILTDAEKTFVREHQSEMTDEEKEAHKDILAEVTPAPEAPAEPEAPEVPEAPEASATETPVEPQKHSEHRKDMVQINASELAKFRETQRKFEFREVQDMVAPFVFSTTNKNGNFKPVQKDAVEKFAFSLNASQREAFKKLLEDMPKANLFTEVGSGEPTEKKAFDEIMEKANALVASEKIGKDAAIKRVYSENPELAKRYREEQVNN